MTLRLRSAALALPLILGRANADAQTAPPTDSQIVTDRPDITESSIVIPKGSLQLENGLTWTTDHGTQYLDASETLIRIGLLARTEFRIVAPNLLSVVSGSPAPSGFGDIALGLKQQLGPLPGNVDLSVIAAVSLPSGSAQVTSHSFDPFIKFPWSKELKTRWSIGGMQSLFWNSQDHTRVLTWESTVYLERELMERLIAFVEYGADVPQAGGSRHVAHFGTAYRVSSRQQIDFHFGFGLSNAAPGRFFAVGYSFRVDHL